MYQNKRVAALILMAGAGERFSSHIPKQFHRIGGKRIYLRTLEPFLHLKEIDHILLVTHPDWIETVKEETLAYGDIVSVIAGGKTRQESSFIGLKELLPYDLVVIHDGARPFISKKIIKDNVAAAFEHLAVDTCIPSTDTLVESSQGLFIDAIGNRNKYLRGQTPQSFSTPLLYEAHVAALKQGVSNASDDCQLVLQFGHKVAIVQGEESNIKITSPLDIYLADQLLRIKTTQPEDCSIFHDRDKDLKGKIFAVVGGTGGIGKEVITQLKERGAEALSLSPSSEIPFDLCAPEAIQKTFSEIYKKYGPLDGLINGGGLLQIKPLAELTLEEIHKMLSINLLGLIYSCKAVTLKKGGVIINIASSSFTYGREGYSIYSAAKSGVVNFTQSLAEERKDIRVNCIVPSRTNTPMRRKNFPIENPQELLDPIVVAKKIIEIIYDSSLTGSIIDIKK